MKRTVANVVMGLGVLGILFASPHSHAFWSRGGFGVHQEINAKALERAPVGFTVLGKDENLTFSPKAIDALDIATLALDCEDVKAYRAEDHFDSNDSNQLSESYDVLALHQFKLMEALKEGNQKIAWNELGELLHTAQDFYSHSTWVWQGHYPTIIDFGTALSKELQAGEFHLPEPPEEIVGDNAQGQCFGDEYWTVNNGIKGITSGYWPPEKAPPLKPSFNKCAHGKVEGTSTASPSNDWLHYYFELLQLRPESGQPQRPGIALDYNKAPAWDTAYNTNAQRAFNLAQTETYKLVSSIVQSVADDPELGMCGVCLLTDNLDKAQCLDAAAVADGTLSACPQGLIMFRFTQGALVRSPIVNDVRLHLIRFDSRGINGGGTTEETSDVLSYQQTVTAYRISKDGTRTGYKPTVCKLGGSWIPKTYHESANYSSTSNHCYCVGVACGQASATLNYDSKFSIDTAGNVLVSDTHWESNARRCPFCTSTQFNHGLYFDEEMADHRYESQVAISLETGAGTFSVTARSTGSGSGDLVPLRACSTNIPVPERPAYTFSSTSDLDGAGSWPAQQFVEVPPLYARVILGAPIMFLPDFEPGVDTLPVECVDPLK